LQWEKINALSIQKTIWGNRLLSDEELLKVLGGAEGVFTTIEDLFAAKEIAIRSMYANVLWR
jgi:hypothetical protein